MLNFWGHSAAVSDVTYVSWHMQILILKVILYFSILLQCESYMQMTNVLLVCHLLSDTKL